MKLRMIALLCSFSVLNACSDDPADAGAPTSDGGAGGSGGAGESGGSGGAAAPDAGPSDPVDPDTAPQAEIDRFSEQAGMLMVRTDDNGLPEANAPVDFDEPPFITHGLGPGGEDVSYYNFDVQPTEPAPIYVLFEEGADMPVEDQLNIVDVVPGSPGYSDFWQVVRVTAPDDYVANTIVSFSDIQQAGLDMETTDTLVNCPIVPGGSTAELRLGDGASSDLVRGWYQGQVVHYFSFEEAPLMALGGMVPVSPIYVTFNENPPEGGPASGFVTEDGTDQTHNVVATVPGDNGYSPLWSVNVYDNADFASVEDLMTAADADILGTGVATVNCPIVATQ